MPAVLRIISAPTLHAARRAADRVCETLVADGRAVARVLPDARQAVLTQRRLADDGASVLGVDVTTPQRWLADRWTLLGDGRRLVDARARRVLVLKALHETPAPSLDPATPGIVGCVETVVRDAAGLAELSPGAVASADLAPRQLDVLAVCEAYMGLLARDGLVEPGEAAALLAGGCGEAGCPHLVLDGISWLGPGWLRLVAACSRGGATLVSRLSSARGDGRANPASALADELARRLARLCEMAGVAVERTDCREALSGDGGWDAPSPWTSEEIAGLAGTLFHPIPGHANDPRGDVRFCMPAGRYAEPEAISRAVRDLVAGGMAPRDVMVVAADPLAMHAAISGRLAVHGIQCRAAGAVPLSGTDAGRAALQLAELQRERRELRGVSVPAPWLRPTASDLARNPLLAVRDDDALAADERWRMTRPSGAADYLDDIAEASENPALAEAVSQNDFVTFIDQLQPPPRQGRPTSDAALARASAGGLAALLAEAGTRGLDALDDVDDLLQGVSARVSRLSVPPSSLAAQQNAAVLAGNPDAVRICTLAEAEGEHARACVVCGLTAADYPLREKVDAADALLATLGVEARPSAVDLLRWRFFSAIEAAGEQLVLERALNDENAGEQRPCALLEEVVDCYRDDVTDVDGLDRATGLPKDGRLPLLEQVGEERVGEVASPLGDALHRAAFSAPQARPLLLRASSREALADPARPLSPSAIEAYLLCPHRWFHERRIPSNGIDAGFSSLEIGSFCHAVLHDVHERLAQGGSRRVTFSMRDDPATRMKVELIVDECFDTQVAMHANVDEDVENRLVAIDRLEQQRVREIRRDLVEAVWRDAWMPRGFVPALHEWSFGMGGAVPPIPYAGALLRGTIDRIDVDGAGRAIVVDYKGGLEDGYGVPDPDKEPRTYPLPLHSQILMYAGALGRAGVGLEPVGCLYASYSKPAMEGVLDAGAVELPEGSGIGEGTLVHAWPDGGTGLAWLLDAVEQRVGDELANHLFAGDIEPRPRFGRRSCAYCRVKGCARRVP